MLRPSPPFERPDEFARLCDGIVAAQRNWATGIFTAWYPAKERRGPEALAKGLQRAGIAKLLRSERTVGGPAASARLNRCGLIIVNRRGRWNATS